MPRSEQGAEDVRRGSAAKPTASCTSGAQLLGGGESPAETAVVPPPAGREVLVVVLEQCRR